MKKGALPTTTCGVFTTVQGLICRLFRAGRSWSILPSLLLCLSGGWLRGRPVDSTGKPPHIGLLLRLLGCCASHSLVCAIGVHRGTTQRSHLKSLHNFFNRSHRFCGYRHLLVPIINCSGKRSYPRSPDLIGDPIRLGDFPRLTQIPQLVRVLRL